MELGLLPPLSGEYENDMWKNSNGAWIRTEIWSCLAPGFPNLAIKYAIMDSIVDHGLGEGTYAAVFIAAMQSIAFYKNNIREIIETALSFIPKTSRVAECVNLVLSEYDKKTDYRDVRNKVVEKTKGLGWFQAPANIGFVIIGLLYGEGDFKKTLIYTINCGDDTDCTGGTAGAVLGIINGISGIPEDWREYIGDRIIQKSVNAHFDFMLPKTCTELTSRIIAQTSKLFSEHGMEIDYSDNENYDQNVAFSVLEGYAKKYFDRSKFSFDVSNFRNISATVEYEKAPAVKEFEDFNFKITFKHLFLDGELLQCTSRLILPDGWTAKYSKNIYIVREHDLFTTQEQNTTGTEQNVYYFTITPNDKIEAKNKVFLMIESPFLHVPFVIPITLLG